MDVKLFDMVETLIDLPEKNIKAGTRGAVIDIYQKPNLAYEVEFGNDSKDDPLQEVVLLPNQIRKSEVPKW